MNTIIYGKRKQGKSTLALALAATYHPRVIVFDPNDMFPLIVSISIYDLPEWADAHTGASFSLVRVGPFDTEEAGGCLTEFSNSLWSEHGISVIIDESHMFQGGNSLHPDLDRWNRRSATDVAVIQTTHRVVDAHPDTRYHADEVFFFYSDLKRELKTVSDNFGESVSVAIPKLGPHQVIYWHKKAGGVPVWEVWDDPKEWYIDLENHNELR